MNNQKICIIGDGLAGLSAATILSQENIKIDLYAGGNKKKILKKTTVRQQYQKAAINLLSKD